MTQQIQESIELGGHTFDVEEFARFPKNHPLLVDEDVRAKQGVPIPRRPMNSACHRNYVGSWRIDEHGALWLCQISGRYRLLEPEITSTTITTQRFAMTQVAHTCLTCIVLFVICFSRHERSFDGL